MLLLLAGVFLISAGLAAMLAGESHTGKTSHGGAVVFGAFGSAVLILVPLEWLDFEPAIAFLGAGALILGAGSVFSSRIGPFLTSLGSSLWGLTWIWIIPDYARIPPLSLWGSSWDWGMTGFAVMTLALAGLTQLGRTLASAQGSGALLGIGIALPAALIAYLAGAYCHAWLLAAFALTCAGLLAYNRSPAHILAGSGGGALLALMPGLLAALSTETIGLEIWSVFLIVYAFSIASLGKMIKIR